MALLASMAWLSAWLSKEELIHDFSGEEAMIFWGTTAPPIFWSYLGHSSHCLDNCKLQVAGGSVIAVDEGIRSLWVRQGQF